MRCNELRYASIWGQFAAFARIRGQFTYIHTYMHACMHTYIHIHIHTHTHTHTHLVHMCDIFAFADSYFHARVKRHVHRCVCMCINRWLNQCDQSTYPFIYPSDFLHLSVSLFIHLRIIRPAMHASAHPSGHADTHE